MHDLRWIRENPEEFDRGLARRGLPPRAAEVLAIDREWRALQTAAEEAQAVRNRLSREVGAAKKRGESADALLAEIAQSKEAEAATLSRAAELRRQLDELLATLPNLPAPDVPDGLDESANVELRRVGDPPRFNFAPLPHEAIGERLGLMDFAAAAKLSGSRFVVLKGALARLERALAQFMLDLHTTEFGYTEIAPPYLVRDETAFGTGNLPKAAEDMFRTTDGLWLIPTAEMPLTNLVAGEILDEAALPLRFTAWTACFRSEAGAAGRDTRGMIRQHQFAEGRAGLDHPARGFRGGARADDFLRRGGLEAARAGLPGHAAVGRRHGVRCAENLRSRSLAAGAERLSRDFELLELRPVPGAADEGPRSAGRRQGDAPGAYAERLRSRGRPHDDRGAGKLPARRWHRRNPGGVAALYGWTEGDRGQWLIEHA